MTHASSTGPQAKGKVAPNRKQRNQLEGLPAFLEITPGHALTCYTSKDALQHGIHMLSSYGPVPTTPL